MRQFLLTEGSSNFIMDAVSESEQMTKRRLIAQQIEVASPKSKKKLELEQAVELSPGFVSVLRDTRDMFVQILACAEGCRWLQIIGKVLQLVTRSAQVGVAILTLHLIVLTLNLRWTLHLKLTLQLTSLLTHLGLWTLPRPDLVLVVTLTLT